MQMRERKYIRFDFTQALHTRATRAERRDYRIIARTQPSDIHRQERSCTPFTLLQRRACVAREASAQQPTQGRLIPVFPIYYTGLHDRRLLAQTPFIALAKLALRAYNGQKAKSIRRDERIKSKRRARSSQSNFSSRSPSHFCCQDVAIADSPAHRTRESIDSRRVIRLRVRDRAAS